MYNTGAESALQEISRSKPILKNRVDPAIQAAVVRIAFDFPAFGQQRVSNELRKLGLFISPGGVRSVWIRHDLDAFDKRLKALETGVAQDGILLIQAQVIALERKKEKREAFGEIETEHPSYLGSQDTYYVANIKELAGFTSRLLSTPIPGWPSPSSTKVSIPLLRRRAANTSTEGRNRSWYRIQKQKPGAPSSKQGNLRASSSNHAGGVLYCGL